MIKNAIIVLPLLCPILPDPALAQNHTVPALRATRTNHRIELDGLIDERAWQSAETVSDFRQIQPREGEPGTEKTEARVLYDDDHIYIGFTCYDREPHRIVAKKLQRDGGMADDDMVAVVLDTYHDRRHAYLFSTNPNGVEEDGQVVDGAFEPDLNWDAVWQVCAAVHEQGWSAEFKIPLWNLRYAPLDSQSWGINFTRLIKRKTEEVHWTSWSRDNGGFLRISRAGDLLDLHGLKPKFNLQIKPYTLGQTRRDNLLQDRAIVSEKLDAGADLKYGVASNLTLDLTLNTDFAQVEADVEQINLTRFPLYFPEKREFFLERASIFQFGEPGFGDVPPILLFFSRRIGIENESLVPILGGGRLTGKVGRLNIGLLDILTDADGDLPKSHFTVARLNQDVFQRSRVGVMFTNRADLGHGGQQVYGADADLWISNPMVFQTFYAQAHNADGSTARSWKLGLDFTKDHWGWFASHMAIDPDFDPRVGFVLRNDIRRTFLAFRVSPQPNGSLLRRTDIRQGFTHIANIENRLQDWTYSVVFQNELSGGDRVDLGYARIFERLETPFDFRPDLRIPSGDYYNHRVSAEFESSTKRKLTAFGSILWREFYAGDLWSYYGGLTFSANSHVALRLDYNRNQIDLPNGALDTDLFGLRLNLAFTTRLFLNTLLQYNSESNELSTNMRLNFIHSPGSDVFIVFNESRGREREDFFDGLPARNREIILKVTQLLRI